MYIYAFLCIYMYMFLCFYVYIYMCLLLVFERTQHSTVISGYDSIDIELMTKNTSWKSNSHSRLVVIFYSMNILYTIKL